MIIPDITKSFDIKAITQCDVLFLEKSEIPVVLKPEINDLMQEKILPIQTCPIFSSMPLISPYNIFVLANALQIRHFSLGEVIQQQGSSPEYMSIVLTGMCKAVYETTKLTAT